MWNGLDEVLVAQICLLLIFPSIGVNNHILVRVACACVGPLTANSPVRDLLMSPPSYSEWVDWDSLARILFSVKKGELDMSCNWISYKGSMLSMMGAMQIFLFFSLSNIVPFEILFRLLICMISLHLIVMPLKRVPHLLVS